MRALYFLAWRNLKQHRLRTALSAFGVALGVATLIAADVTGSAIRDAAQSMEESEQAVSFVGDFLNTGLALMGLVILAAAGFLIFNAFGMAITQRQQHIGALRSLGMTRPQVMGLALTEALLTGGGGTLLGMLAGPLLGKGLVTALARLAHISHGEGRVALTSLLLAGSAGLGITFLATLGPAWRAARVPPLVALRPQSRAIVETGFLRLAAPGLALVTGLMAYLTLNPPAAAVLPPPWDMVLTALFGLGWLMGLALLLPFLIDQVSAGIRRLGGRSAAVGRLASDNLRRARGRVMLTIITLAVGLMTIVSVTGITRFLFDLVLVHTIGRYNLEWVVVPLPPTTGDSPVSWETLSQWNMEAMRLTPSFMRDLEQRMAGRARLIDARPLLLPQLAILSGLPSYVVDPLALRQADLFTFAEGDWDAAQPILERGCGLLLTPRMARQHHVGLYDTLTLNGENGPVTCTVAGLGTSSFMGTTLISLAASDPFGLDLDQVFVVIVQPLPGVDKAALRADLDALLADYPGNSLIDVDIYFRGVTEMVDNLQVLLNGMLLLAILAAALGVVNTTMMSVTERRRELGLLRAVGATRGQVLAVVAGEAAWMGVIGGGLGLAAGVGLVVVFVAVNGGNMYGVSDLPLWSTTWKAVQPAIVNGVVGVAAAPLICAGAAWLPTRALARERVIEMIRTE
jgi:putative ABC transport system permease protein